MGMTIPFPLKAIFFPNGIVILRTKHTLTVQDQASSRWNAVHLKVIEWWKLSLGNYTYLQLIVLWDMKSRCCLDFLPLQSVYCESNCNTKDMFDQSGIFWMILDVNLQMWQVSCSSTSPLFPSLSVQGLVRLHLLAYFA